MPASMMTACVAFSPNVTGSRIEMPDSGPMSGSTPTRVPTRQPRMAYQRFPGWSATAKPCIRLTRVVSISGSETPRAVGQRRLQRIFKAEICDRHDGGGISAGAQRIAPLDHDEDRRHHQDQRDEKAKHGVER